MQPGASPGLAQGNPKSTDPPRYLEIAGSAVARAEVHITAMYSGEIDDRVFTEFQRRYGYADYVVLQTRDGQGGKVGRVYAWSGNSKGVNKPLIEAPDGARARVRDASGQVLFEGEVIARHDFDQAVVRKELRSPDGRFSARICEAGFPGANAVFVTDVVTGQETRWQAGPRNGDLYLDAMFLGSALLALEGKPDDQLLFQLHDRGHFASEVLGPQALLEDAAAAGIDVKQGVPPRIVSTRLGMDSLEYTGEFTLSDGGKLQKTFVGTLRLTSDGFVRLEDRHPVGH